MPRSALPSSDFAVLELPPSERDAVRVGIVAASLGEGGMVELPFLRNLTPEELTEACRTQLRIERIAPGQAICLQGEDADSAYVVLSGTVSCHIRKDLQQLESSLAYDTLRGELAEAAEAAVAAQAAAAATAVQTATAEAAAPAPAGAGSFKGGAGGGGARSPGRGGGGASLTAAAGAQAASSPRESGRAAAAVGGGGRYLSLPGVGPPTTVLGGAFQGGGVWQRAAAASAAASVRAAASTVLTGSAVASQVRQKAADLVGPSVAVLGAGDSFGEASLASSDTAAASRAATAVCNVPTALLVCPRTALSAGAGDREAHTLDFLRAAPLLRPCTHASLVQLLRNSKHRTYAIHDTLTREGARAIACAIGIHRHRHAPVPAPTPPWTLAHATSAVRSMLLHISPRPPSHPPSSSLPASPLSPTLLIPPRSPRPPAGTTGNCLPLILSGHVTLSTGAAAAAAVERGAHSGEDHTPRQVAIRTIGAGQVSLIVRWIEPN